MQIRFPRSILVPVALIATLASCSAVPQIALNKVQVTRSADGGFELNWSTSTPAVPVDIWVATDPAATAADRRQIADDITLGKFKLSADQVDAGKRAYFWVKPEQGTIRMVAERVLPLEGGRNFRDLGGYQTSSGATVKWGILYRSGVMTGLTQQDYNYLRQLGINQICDFRAKEEILGSVDKLDSQII